MGLPRRERVCGLSFRTNYLACTRCGYRAERKGFVSEWEEGIQFGLCRKCDDNDEACRRVADGLLGVCWAMAQEWLAESTDAGQRRWGPCRASALFAESIAGPDGSVSGPAIHDLADYDYEVTKGWAAWALDQARPWCCRAPWEDG